jgi:hypothetical protein
MIILDFSSVQLMLPSKNKTTNNRNKTGNQKKKKNVKETEAV